MSDLKDVTDVRDLNWTLQLIFNEGKFRLHLAFYKDDDNTKPPSSPKKLEPIRKVKTHKDKEAVMVILQNRKKAASSRIFLLKASNFNTSSDNRLRHMDTTLMGDGWLANWNKTCQELSKMSKGQCNEKEQGDEGAVVHLDNSDDSDDSEGSDDSSGSEEAEGEDGKSIMVQEKSGVEGRESHRELQGSGERNDFQEEVKKLRLSLLDNPYCSSTSVALKVFGLQDRSKMGPYWQVLRLAKFAPPVYQLVEKIFHIHPDTTKSKFNRLHGLTKEGYKACLEKLARGESWATVLKEANASRPKKKGCATCTRKTTQPNKTSAEDNSEYIQDQERVIAKLRKEAESSSKEAKSLEPEAKRQKIDLEQNIKTLEQRNEKLMEDLGRSEEQYRKRRERDMDQERVIAKLRKEAESSSKEAKSLEPEAKRQKILTTWDNSAIEEGQEVGVIYTLPKEQLFYGRVQTMNLEKVKVAFYKTTKKSISTSVVERTWVDPIYIVDNHVQLSKDGSTLSLSKAEEMRIKEKTKKYWNAAD
uniref:Uncharacterized protein n=1 Tax=Branchiostoma floridae TaxID=7739 RepID=C3Z9I5_BRAFL|eukprot:XP_002594670.1 hypothetical protein BRAFLDRAFT_104857 [Branchiostoma floridae]